MTLKTLCIAQDPAADQLLTDEPLALLLGMLLDQQVPMETAFRGPAKLRERLGHLDAPTIATADPERFAAAMSTPPAVHRYPGSMGGRIQALCQTLVDEYDGRAEAVWETAEDGRELLARLRALPGFGDQKARIFLALLGKQLGVCPTGWRDAAGPYGDESALRSVADVTSPETLLGVRAYKQAAKAKAKATRT